MALHTHNDHQKNHSIDFILKNLSPSTSGGIVRKILLNRLSSIIHPNDIHRCVVPVKDGKLNEIAFVSLIHSTDRTPPLSSDDFISVVIDLLSGYYYDDRYWVCDYHSNKNSKDKRDFLFSGLPENVRKNIQMDDVALYSVSDMENADSVSMVFKHFLTAPLPSSSSSSFPSISLDSLVITDGCACIGGNTLSFSKFFSNQIFAVEYDKTRYDMINHNIQLLHRTNIIAKHGSYPDILHEWNQDALFLDPPWGGMDYGNKESIDCLLGEFSTSQVCALVRRVHGASNITNAKGLLDGKETRFIGLKLPNNFDLPSFLSYILDHEKHQNDMLPDIPEPPPEVAHEKKDCVICGAFIGILRYPKMLLVLLDYSEKYGRTLSEFANLLHSLPGL